MAYNFLSLVNDINQRTNEVPLNSTNFFTAAGFYSTAKQAVNTAINQINHDTFQWPFNYILNEETLTAGTNRYTYPYDAKWVDFNTFRIKRDATFGNETQILSQMDYEQYLRHYIDDEYNTSDTSIREIPKYVARSPAQEFILHPVPDKDYELAYEYYVLPVELELHTDVPTVPSQFRHVIVDGAMYYVYQFRNDLENSQFMFSKFNEGLVNMRKIYQNRYEYMRDTRVHRHNDYSGYRNL